MKTYKSSLDGIAKSVPWFVLLIAAMSFITPALGIRSAKGGDSVMLRLAMIISVVVLPALVITLYLLRTKSITLTDSSIIIDRMVRPVVVDFNDIKSIRRIEQMAPAIRTFGNGGIFGYTGKYYNKELGHMTWYCTRRGNYILIEKNDGKKLMITPDEPDTLINDISAMRPGQQV